MVIDEDLGQSASRAIYRSGFERLVAEVLDELPVRRHAFRDHPDLVAQDSAVTRTSERVSSRCFSNRWVDATEPLVDAGEPLVDPGELPPHAIELTREELDEVLVLAGGHGAGWEGYHAST